MASVNSETNIFHNLKRNEMGPDFDPKEDQYEIPKDDAVLSPLALVESSIDFDLRSNSLV